MFYNNFFKLKILFTGFLVGLDFSNLIGINEALFYIVKNCSSAY